MVEDCIFKRFTGVKEIVEVSKALCGQADIKIDRSYFFKEERFMQIDEYVLNKVYRYSEFHVNTFISLIPFSFIAPLYLSSVLQIPWNYCVILVFISVIVALVMLYNGYNFFKLYHWRMNSVICSYLKYEYYIHLSAKQISCDRNFELNATIFDKESEIRVLKGGIKVNFKSTLGNIALKNNGKTDVYGIARATLTSNKGGVAIVTASSRKCILGITRCNSKSVLNILTWIEISDMRRS